MLNFGRFRLSQQVFMHHAHTFKPGREGGMPQFAYSIIIKKKGEIISANMGNRQQVCSETMQLKRFVQRGGRT